MKKMHHNKNRRKMLRRPHPKHGLGNLILHLRISLKAAILLACLTTTQATFAQEMVGKNTVGQGPSAKSIETLYDTIMAMTDRDDWRGALPLAKILEEKTQTRFGFMSDEHAMAMASLGEIYNRLGEYAFADIYLKAVLRIDSVLYGANDTLIGDDLYQLAWLEENKSHYDQALQYLERSRYIYLEALGPSSPALGNIYQNMGRIHEKLGHFEKAKALFLEALRIDSLAFGDDDFALSEKRFALAGIYQSMGDFQLAKALYLQAMKGIREAKGVQNIDYANCLNSIAIFYGAMGESERAIDSIHKATRIYHELMGVVNPQYARLLNTEGALYMADGFPELTVPLFQLVLRIDSLTIGTQNDVFATHLSNLAMAHAETGDYPKAALLLEQAQHIDSIALGTNHPQYALHLNNLALIYDKIGYLEKSEIMFQHALAIYRQVTGPFHPEVENLNYNLAMLHLKMGEEIIMAKEIEIGFASSLESKVRQMQALSASQRFSYWRTHGYVFAAMPVFVFPSGKPFAKLGGIGYESSMLSKGFLLRSNQAFEIKAAQTKSPSDQAKLAEIAALNREIVRLDMGGTTTAEGNRSQLAAKEEALEKSLLWTSPALRNHLLGLKLQWEDVQAALPDSAAAIEFVHYPFIRSGTITDSIWYGAYVLRRGDSLPIVVSLGPEHLLQLADRSGVGEKTDFTNSVSKLYRGVQPGANSILQENSLYSFIWKPFDSLLQDVRHIYFSATWELQNIAFAAIPTDDGKLLSERYHLVQLGTTGTLVTGRKPLHFKDITNAALYGGMDYDLDSTALRESLPPESFAHRGGAVGRVHISDSVFVQPFGPLIGAKEEVVAIEKLMASNAVPTRVVLGHDAIEERFKLEAHVEEGQGKVHGSPTILHIATHGFSHPPKEKSKDFDIFYNQAERFHFAEDPLQRSGLAFSGANLAWTGGKQPTGVDDGILTAAEISVMDLRDTRLVVLSACQSGIGDLRGNEGVFGLQRAFKLAGVDMVIASLWKVPDEETAEFMNLFYTEFINNRLEVREAFRKAQKEMRDRYPDEPYKWAAFLLFE